MTGFPDLGIFKRWPQLVELERTYNNGTPRVPYTDAREVYKLCLELALYIQQKELVKEAV